MKKLKIKLITGYRKDQEISIDADEAHKAYYLFLNPEKRGIFNNGLAIVGKDIDRILPDYQGSMGWNPNYAIEGTDWEDIRAARVDVNLQHLLSQAKLIATAGNPEQLNAPLTLLIEAPVRSYSQGPRSIGEIAARTIHAGRRSTDPVLPDPSTLAEPPSAVGDVL